MGPLVLVGFVSLWAGLVLAEVNPGFTNCKDYFYKKTEPLGFVRTNTAICQRYRNEYFFATLYDNSSRIPVWSAYTLTEGTCKGTNENWKVEPQLSTGFSNFLNMKTLGELREDFKGKKEEKDKLKDRLKVNQAISEDYERTGFDRGHLNPRCYQTGPGKDATFTLTNAVPMDPEFNEQQWRKTEQDIKRQLTNDCLYLGGKAFLVTGAVPNATHKIPTKDSNRDAERVVVPSHIWTAACCDHTDQTKKFSFAFLGENKKGSTVERMTVMDLDNELKKLYHNLSIQIFNDNCEKSRKRPADEAGSSKAKYPRLSQG